jgi:hypothetical protein
MSALLDLFAELERPPARPGEVSLRARPIPGSRSLRLAKDHLGYPNIVVVTAESSPRPTTPVQLANFSYRPSTRALVETDGRVEHESLAILTCTSDDPDLHSWFLATIAGLADVLSAAAEEPGGLDRAVDRLVTLFLALRRPASRSVEGLWGEVLVIALSRDPDLLLAAWHSDPLEKYDFVAGLGRLEIKTAIGARREHHFSLEQLLTPESVRLAVVSILANPTPSGASVADLVSLVETRARVPGLRSKLRLTVSETLGGDWKRAADQRFSIEEGRRSMLMFDGRTIPKVSPDLPPEVSDVRFRVELDGVPTLAEQEVASVPVWAAAVAADDGPRSEVR